MTRLILPQRLEDERRRRLDEFDTRTSAFMKKLDEDEAAFQESIMREYASNGRDGLVFAGILITLMLIVSVVVEVLS